MRLCHAAWVKSPHISLSEHVNSYFPSRNEKCYSFEREHDKVRWTTKIWGKVGEKYFALFHCSNHVSASPVTKLLIGQFIIILHEQRFDESINKASIQFLTIAADDTIKLANSG